MSQQQPTFASMGNSIRTLANYAAYTLGLIIIIGLASTLSLIGGFYFAIAGLVIIIILVVITCCRAFMLTLVLIPQFESIGNGMNIPQFKLFARFLFNSLAVALIAFFWALICTLIMLAPAFFPYSYYSLTLSTPVVNISMAGEITLCIVILIMGFAFMPHAFKSWKTIDDYFMLLNDPWAKDIGLVGTRRILDGYKVALGCTILVFAAIGYHYVLVYFTIPSIIVCVLIAGGKHIQGLYRVGTAFTRIPTSAGSIMVTPHVQNQPVRTPQTPAYQPPSTSAPQPAYLRYQTTPAMNNPGSVTPAQRTPTQDPLANTTGIQRQILERNQAFHQAIDDETTLHASHAPVTPIRPASYPQAGQGMVQATRMPVTNQGTASRCKYCFTPLPSINTTKCPACGAALLNL
jgi:hypothetical protein